MNRDVPPLSPRALALLDAERLRPDVPRAVADDVLARLASSVASGVGGSMVAHAPWTSRIAARLVRAGLTWRSLPWIALAFVGGGATGAALRHDETPRATPVIVASSAPSSSTSAPSPSPTSSDVLAASSSAPPRPPPPRDPSPAPSAIEPNRDVDLAHERAFLDRARMALARGENGAALDALAEDARTFPHGRMIEEREALLVQALVAAGRTREARLRGDAFRARFPTSALLAAVDLALATPQVSASPDAPGNSSPRVMDAAPAANTDPDGGSR